jgi:hypothetical protein
VKNKVTTQRHSLKVFTIPAGILSLLLTLNGLAAVRGLDLRQNTFLSAAYCALPLLSLPLYLLALGVRRLLPLQAVLVLAYIPVYSALNWRTCAELGYCGSVMSVVAMTIMTSKVLLFWGVALSSLAAFVVERRDGERIHKRGAC